MYVLDASQATLFSDTKQLSRDPGSAELLNFQYEVPSATQPPAGKLRFRFVAVAAGVIHASKEHYFRFSATTVAVQVSIIHSLLHTFSR